MNIWIFSAGIISLLTAFIHLLAGQIDPVRPFLKSNLPDVPKATLLACWHVVSVTLFICGFVLTYIGWFNLDAFLNVVFGISTIFVIFALVFVAVGWYFFGAQTFIKLPQWFLLLPIGVLGLIGVT